MIESIKSVLSRGALQIAMENKVEQSTFKICTYYIPNNPRRGHLEHDWYLFAFPTIRHSESLVLHRPFQRESHPPRFAAICCHIDIAVFTSNNGMNHVNKRKFIQVLAEKPGLMTLPSGFEYKRKNANRM